MKRLFTSVLLFAGIFCLTSCSSPMGGGTVRENKLNCAFTSPVTMSLDKLNAEGTVTRLGDGEWTAEFDSPNTLSGVKLTFSSGSVTADYKGLTFSVPKSALPVKAMLGNLIGNAVKASAPDSPVYLTAKPGEIEIRDCGKGMNAEQLAYVNDPSHAKNPSVRSGLGVPLCHEIAALHRAKLVFTSKEGEGTTATVRFGV